MSTTSRLLRATWGAFLALMIVGAFSIPARSATDEIKPVAHFNVQLPKDADFLAARPSSSLIFDSDARRAFQIIKLASTKDQTIRAWDLDTRKVVKEATLPAAAILGGAVAPTSQDGSSAEWLHVLDEGHGILYLGYLSNQANFGGIVAISTKTLAIIHNFPRAVVNGLETAGVDCALTGSQRCLPQTPTVSVYPKGLALVPSELTGLPDKLLVMMQEPNTPATNRNANVLWLAQWDATTGHQDWIYRVQACQSSSEYGGADSQFQVALFEARIGAGIYLSCLSSGGAGQVVRLTVDNLNAPTAEQAYPGPLQAQDAIPDIQADRLLIKVQATTGQSWWVFDGRSSSYAGVVGVTSSAAITTAGIDPISGRLYVTAPATGSTGHINPGGLLISDTRRNPAPQPLQFPEFAQAKPGQVEIDTHPITGKRLVWVPSGEALYTIYEDNIPISDDPQLSDLDRLTIDEQEQTGVTGHNYTGGGHAYGLRVHLVGGTNGVPPPGPDVLSFRVGRHSAVYLNSPCGYSDRELVLGAVDEAALSNNLSNASAAIAKTDPGTKTDLAQPTQRCYPRPQYSDGHGGYNDIWDFYIRQQYDKLAHQDIGEYPRPLDKDSDNPPNGTSDIDEYAGTTWPIESIECAGDNQKETKVTTKPLDRGGKASIIPPDIRNKEFTPDQYTALVSCKLKDNHVVATAGGAAFSTDTPLGAITVGEVSASVEIGLVKDRGLVTTTIAKAGNITIGDHIKIDAAYAKAESWAAGRPGTAGTSFERLLCGVHIKDEAPTVNANQPGVNADTNDPSKSTVDPQGGEPIQKQVDQQGCGDPNQPALGTQPLIDNMNKVLGARGRVSAPQPDGPLSQGTPGGYLASLEKDRLQQVSARAVQNDSSTEVPALEITIFNDDPTEGRGRQIYQLAGVDASTTYGIYLLNPPEQSFDCVGDCLGAPLPTVIDTPSYTPPEEQQDQAPLPSGSGPVTIVYAGISFLLRRPLDALLAAAVWAILFSPVRLATRRRALRALGSGGA